MQIIDKPIRSFRGKYFFLSNFYEAPLRFHTIWYESSEAAFQAQKTMDTRIQYAMSKMKPGAAKKLGQVVPLREDWSQIKDAVMWQILIQKFYFNVPLVEMLCDTGTAQLIEGNKWGDKYWGVCGGVGENRLGYMLMQIRNYYTHQPVQYDRKLLRSLAYYNI